MSFLSVVYAIYLEDHSGTALNCKECENFMIH
jgi:hypothetical protein